MSNPPPLPVGGREGGATVESRSTPTIARGGGACLASPSSARNILIGDPPCSPNL